MHDTTSASPAQADDDARSSSLPPPTSATKAPGIAGFDLNSLRLTQDFAQVVKAEKKLVTVPIRKPSKQDWFRVHPDQEFQTFVLELKEDRDVYLVDRALWSPLQKELSARLLVPAITRAGTAFVWPLRVPGPDGRVDDWIRSSLEAVRVARSHWTRMEANMGLSAYEISTSAALLDQPVWPKESLEELLQLAFRDKVITAPDHPALRRLRGEI